MTRARTTLARASLACITLAISAASLAMRAHAQSTATDSSSCLGFAFGTWTPALNWKAAGHVNPLDSAHVGEAPRGRGWAANDTAGKSPYLMLFPTWWPAGVSLELPTQSPARGDTVVGKATALVADSRLRAPTSTVHAWRVECGAARRLPDGGQVATSAAADPMIGRWKGSSTCVARRATCRDESVIYYVTHRDGTAASGSLSIDARRIVSGKEEPTVILSCDRDNSTSIVACTTALGTWRFLDQGRTLEGALTLNDGTQLRSVKARRATS